MSLELQIGPGASPLVYINGDNTYDAQTLKPIHHKLIDYHKVTDISQEDIIQATSEPVMIVGIVSTMILYSSPEGIYALKNNQRFKPGTRILEVIPFKFVGVELPQFDPVLYRELQRLAENNGLMVDSENVRRALKINSHEWNQDPKAISFEEAIQKFNNNEILTYRVGYPFETFLPHLQEEVLTLFGKDNKVYLLKANYYPPTNQILKL